ASDPGTLFSPLAAASARSLAPPEGWVRARPTGTVSTGHLYAGHGPFDPGAVSDLSFDAREHAFPPVGGVELRVADAWVFRVDHWSDLLWANLLALGPFLWARLATPASLAWAVARRWTLRPELLAGALVERDGAFVHPSATVEFSVLAPGARVGAGAVVRGTVLGPGACVEELAMVEACVLGEGARIQRQAMAKFSVIEHGAAHAGVVQLGVLGAGAEVRQGAVLFDQSLGEPVRVRRAGTLVAAPHGMVGACIGPGSVVGQGVRVAAGRAVPPGLTVLPDPSAVLTRVEVPEGATRARVVNGRLEVLS
ncbi:MAG: hypothetical protein FJ090_19205, partial [Deltaproteobacteria bacterium]|nr:hypothetical protein [Deltaproteobacteria bacterium]